MGVTTSKKNTLDTPIIINDNNNKEWPHFDDITIMLEKLKHINKEYDYIERKIIINTLYNLYYIYIKQCSDNNIRLLNILHHSKFFISIAIYLDNHKLNFNSISSSYLIDSVKNISIDSHLYILVNEKEYIKSLIKIYNTFIQEEELFGLELVSFFKNTIKLDNIYKLSYSTEISQYMNNSYSINGKELFNILIKSVTDCRNFNLIDFYNKIDSYKLEILITPLSSSSGGNMPLDREININNNKNQIKTTLK